MGPRKRDRSRSSVYDSAFRCRWKEEVPGVVPPDKYSPFEGVCSVVEPQIVRRDAVVSRKLPRVRGGRPAAMTLHTAGVQSERDVHDADVAQPSAKRRKVAKSAAKTKRQRRNLAARAEHQARRERASALAIALEELNSAEAKEARMQKRLNKAQRLHDAAEPDEYIAGEDSRLDAQLHTLATQVQNATTKLRKASEAVARARNTYDTLIASERAGGEQAPQEDEHMATPCAATPHASDDEVSFGSEDETDEAGPSGSNAQASGDAADEASGDATAQPAADAVNDGAVREGLVLKKNNLEATVHRCNQQIVQVNRLLRQHSALQGFQVSSDRPATDVENVDELDCNRTRDVREPPPAERPAPATGKVALKDVKLEKFSGNTDPEAHVIAKEQFLPLLEWLRASAFQIEVSGLSDYLHVTALIMHLSGAAQKAFMARYGAQRGIVRTWTLDRATQAIASLVPEHKVLFTQTALKMKFSVHTLADDVQKYALYMRNGDIPVDRSEFVFQDLQSKLLSVSPDMFSIAASSYNLRFEYNINFERTIASAMQIIHTLHMHDRLKPVQEAKRGRTEGASGSGGGEKSRTRDSSPAWQKPKSRADKRGRAQRSEGGKGRGGPAGGNRGEFERLAREYNRCYGCGKYVTGADLAEHKSSCVRNKAEFSRRMGIVRKLVGEGKGSEVNTFPSGGSKAAGK